MIELPFTKMHGLGNCFILMDDRATQASPVQTSVDRAGSSLKDLAIAVCDRNFGIGADGLILVRDSSVADFEMRIFNEDGSEPEMCGNGIRCFARFVVDEGIIDVGAISDKGRTQGSPLHVETLAGIMETRLLDNGDVEVDMGEPRFQTDDVVGAVREPPLHLKEQDREFTFVSMGNPHAITFVDELDFDWKKTGASVERSGSFPNRTNVEFVKVVDDREAVVKVWERGCGETMACGTGACAVAVAGSLHGLFPRKPVSIHLPGGTLKIHWTHNNHVMMTGPAVTVCKGTFFF